jgi:hypothetical protein
MLHRFEAHPAFESLQGSLRLSASGGKMTKGR